MISNFITMNGYGIYVWLSFSVALIACGTVYFKTKKTLKKEKQHQIQLFQTGVFFLSVGVCCLHCPQIVQVGGFSACQPQQRSRQLPDCFSARKRAESSL